MGGTGEVGGEDGVVPAIGAMGPGSGPELEAPPGTGDPIDSIGAVAGSKEPPDAPASTPGGGRSGATIALIAGLVTLAVVVIVAGVAYTVSKGSGHEVTGSITVLDSDYLGRSPGGGCDPTGGYGDIDSGSQVTIEDGAGTTLAVGKLGSGTYVDLLEGLDSPTTTSRSRSASDLKIVGCRLPISVAAVPEADFYRVQIGRRDPYEISRADLEADGWAIELSLGDPI